jgi:hypothetical protein
VLFRSDGPSNPGWGGKALLVLLKNEKDLEHVHEIFNSSIAGLEQLPIAFKAPGKRPTSKVGGVWKEWDSWPANLKF